MASVTIEYGLEVPLTIGSSSVFQTVMNIFSKKSTEPEVSTDPEFNAMMDEFYIAYGIKQAPKKKKNVSFFQDVPYKHSDRTGEVFEGPVTSQLTYEKEKGEDTLVFVNPEYSA
jgi:hypothetical protein